MSTSTSILLTAAFSVIVVSVTTVYLFRRIVRKAGVEKVLNEGIVLTETGIEFPGLLFIGKRKANYADIESVQFVPFPNSLLLRLRYGSSVESGVSGRWNFFEGTVVIKFKQPFVTEYHLFKPSDPEQFIEELESRINKSVTSGRHE